MCVPVSTTDKNPPAPRPEHLRQTLGTQEKEEEEEERNVNSDK
jgi:hypothetical protein